MSHPQLLLGILQQRDKGSLAAVRQLILIDKNNNVISIEQFCT